MVVLGISIKNNKDLVKEYLEGFKQRQEEMQFNPFNVSFKLVGKDLYAFSFDTIFPKVYWVAIPMLISIFIFKGLSWLMLVGLLFAFPIVFDLPKFYYFMIVLGLKKKHKIKGSVSYVKSSELVRRCLIESKRDL